MKKEILLGILFALLIMGLLVFTVDEAPQWIYQGF